MKNALIAFGIILGALACLPLAGAESSDTDGPGPALMRKKLNLTSGVLEGITLEKYDLILTNAMLLRNIDLTNAFFRLHDAEYAENLKKFQVKVDRLVLAGKEQNLEKSFEAYSQLIGSCVACHKHFRREQLLRNQRQAQGTPR